MIILILDFVIIAECAFICAWYCSDFDKRLMVGLGAAFGLIGLSFLIFALPRDFLYALGYDSRDQWWMSRSVVMPWRFAVATALGAIAGIVRFGNWKDGA